MKAKNYNKEYHYFYIVEDCETGSKYAGIHSTDSLDDGYIGSGKIIKSILRKSGPSRFYETTRVYFDTREQASDYEREFVTAELVESKEWYNLRTGGDNGSVPSKETRDKISRSHKGKTISKETRAKISESAKGRIGITPSKETKRKISQALKGKMTGEKNPFYGKTHTNETKEQMSLSAKNRPAITNETRLKMSDSRKGRTNSAESNEQRRNTMLGQNTGPQKKIQCPYCLAIGGISNMKRYHFNNCKHNLRGL